MPENLDREWRDDPRLAGARVEVYRRIDDRALLMCLFEPTPEDGGARPAIVFFHGGGWQGGEPAQFGEHCRYLASRGMVAMTAEYRLGERLGATVRDCVADAHGAVRWVRANADRLGVDPHRVAAGGGSAGGHLAAAAALLADPDDPGDRPADPSTPDALVLFNPALSTRRWMGPGEETRAVSPLDHVRPGAPPTIIFHGTDDETVPIEQAEQFTRLMRAAGNRCDLVPFEGAGHGFFNFARDPEGAYRDTVRAADRFLASLGWLDGAPSI